MNELQSTLQWISDWFKVNCDGDWEHENQIMIQTISNPGWLLTVDLSDTTLENIEREETFDNSETDWYFYTISEKKFTGSGDLSKLPSLLYAFQENALLSQE
ncbi:immunity 53 family protein [Fibrella aquatilis]|uniref:Immunity 53 family protein n=1 Tax=Fibrella aquatilis TaxID=2817059 RepID=A0A939JZX8_9BACT|nr:immunity 53 family protein [Fibrella aquatilis]MBO0930655.1 immunity 53 family protein [Fibrella aquatilis]